MEKVLRQRLAWDSFGAFFPLIMGVMALLLVGQSLGVAWEWLGDGTLMPPAVVLAVVVLRELSARDDLENRMLATFGLMATMTSASALFTIATLPDDTWGEEYGPTTGVLATVSLVLFALVIVQGLAAARSTPSPRGGSA